MKMKFNREVVIRDDRTKEVIRTFEKDSVHDLGDEAAKYWEAEGAAVKADASPAVTAPDVVEPSIPEISTPDDSEEGRTRSRRR